MPLWDVTRRLGSRTEVWPGDAPVELELSRSADGVAVGRLACSVHAGTHVDAPAHFYAGGRGVDELPLDILVGPCLVAELDTAVTPPAFERILFRTRGARLDEPGARRLLAAGVRLVGVDAMSIEPDGSDALHRLLLGAGVVIVENLDLEGVRSGEYELLCLPLKLEDADGAPARVVLKRG